MQHDPAMIQSNYNRNPSDQYWTEPWVTEALVHHFPMLTSPGYSVWEPACGAGHMVRALSMSEVDVRLASDIDMTNYQDDYDHRYTEHFQHDFLLDPIDLDETEINTIITNPPFNCHEKFLRHSLNFPYIKIVCMLLRSDFKSAKRRIDLFEDERFVCELVLTSRPRWDDWWNGKPPKHGPRHNYSWFVWDDGYEMGNIPKMMWHRRTK